MGRKVGLRDIADAAGVSLATVSRVFNQHPNVRDGVRKKVLATAKRLDYAAGKGARRDHVTILVEGLAGIGRSGYQAAMLGAMVSKLADAGYRPDVLPVESADLELIAGHYALATIAFAWDEKALRRVLKASQAPCILMNGVQEGWHSVVTDHKQGVADAVNFLHEQGHRRIGFVRYLKGSWADRERFAGYCDGLANHRLPYVPELEVAFNHPPLKEKFSTLQQSLKALMKAEPTAVIACSGDLALPVAHAVRVLGGSIPEDLSLVTFEHAGASAFHNPSLTAINQNPERLAAAALNLVDQFAKAEPTELATVVLPNDLIIRESVRFLGPESK